DAPKVTVSPSGRGILITDDWFGTDNTVFVGGTQTWIGSFDGSTISGLREGGGTAPGCRAASSGPIDDTRSYVLCLGLDGVASLVRFDSSGQPIDQGPITLSDRQAALDGLTQVIRTGDYVYLWQPAGHTLIQFDLRTGEHRIATAATTAATSSADPLAI